MSKRAAISMSVLASLFLSMGSALAHTSTVLDGDETPSPLDIVYARQSHGPDRSLAFKVGTYEEWSNEVVAGGSGWLGVAFDVDMAPNRQEDRVLFVSQEQGQLRGRLYKSESWIFPTPELVGEVEVARPDTHSFRAVVPRWMLGRKRDSFRWHATSSFEDESREGCEPPPEGQIVEGYHRGCSDWTRWRRHVEQT